MFDPYRTKAARLPLNGQLRDMLDEMRKALDDLESGTRLPGEHEGKCTPNVYQMIGLLSAIRRDGRPGSSRFGKTGHANVKDENGVPIPPRSDPTGEAAVDPGTDRDPVYGHIQAIVDGITTAVGSLRKARTEMILGSQYAELRPPEPGCSSCERIGSWVPAEDNGRCRWCYDFWLAEGCDPTIWLLQERAAGKRITQPMVNQALAKVKGRRRKPVAA
jgi:hypothetical protein